MRSVRAFTTTAKTRVQESGCLPKIVRLLLLLLYPSGDRGFTPQRGDRLLEDDDDGSAVLEWVLFAAERRGKYDFPQSGRRRRPRTVQGRL